MKDNPFQLALFTIGCSDDKEESGTYQNPKKVDVGKEYHEHIKAFGTVFYKFVSTGGYYKIEITDLESDLDFDLYEDATFWTLLASGAVYPNSSDEQLNYLCSAKTYCIAVDE